MREDRKMEENADQINVILYPMQIKLENVHSVLNGRMLYNKLKV